MTTGKRIDRRKRDRHKPRKGDRHKGHLLGAHVTDELLQGMTKVARDRGVPVTVVIRESYRQTVAEHEKFRNAGQEIASSNLILSVGSESKRPIQIRHDQPAPNSPTPGKKS